MGDVATYYFAANRNKRSLALDLATEEGYGQLEALVQEADAVVQNFTGAVSKRLKVDFASIHRINPSCVYCSISGFGPEDDERPAYDMVMQGLAGLMSLTGDGASSPTRIGVPVVDLAAGLFAAVAVAAALYQRAQGAQDGHRLEVSLYGAAISLLSNQGMSWLLAGVEPGPSGPDHAHLAPYGVFRAGEGYLTIAVGNDGQFEKLCRALGLPQLTDQAEFKGNAERVRHRDALRTVIEMRLSTEGAREWEARLQRAGVPCGAVRSVREAIEDARGQWVGTAPEGGRALEQLLCPVLVNGDRLDPYLPPPSLNELGLELRGRGAEPRGRADEKAAR